MLARFDRRQWIVLGACAIVELAFVAVVAQEEPTAGTFAVLVALLLAPVAVVGVAATAARFAGGYFPSAAAVVYVLLPFLASRFVLAPDRGAFDRHALPALPGLQAPGLFALGVAAVVLAAVAPERVAAAVGVAGVVVALVVWPPDSLGEVRTMLHETGWSVALPEWLLVATVLAAIFRRPFLGAALGCVAVAATLRASHHPLADAGFWRALAPLAPTAGVLLSSLWLLVPRLRLAQARRPAS